MADRVQIILVPVGGSNEPVRPVKPLPYRHQRRDAPTRPPSKGAATVRLLRGMVEQEAAVREMLRPQHR